MYRRDSKRLPCLTDLNYDWEGNYLFNSLKLIIIVIICRDNLLESNITSGTLTILI